MTASLRRNGFPDIVACTVDRRMPILGVQGRRRGKKVRTTIPAKDGRRAGDLLDRDFSAPAPNRVWVADSSYVRTWLGFVYVALIVDVFAQRIIAWHAATSKVTDLVMIPLRMALWQRTYEGHPAELGQLIGRRRYRYSAHHRHGLSAPTDRRFSGPTTSRGLPVLRAPEAAASSRSSASIGASHAWVGIRPLATS
jgi:transposase InsO family protein